MAVIHAAFDLKSLTQWHTKSYKSQDSCVPSFDSQCSKEVWRTRYFVFFNQIFLNDRQMAQLMEKKKHFNVNYRDIPCVFNFLMIPIVSRFF